MGPGFGFTLRRKESYLAPNGERSIISRASEHSGDPAMRGSLRSLDESAVAMS